MWLAAEPTPRAQSLWLMVWYTHVMVQHQGPNRCCLPVPKKSGGLWGVVDGDMRGSHCLGVPEVRAYILGHLLHRAEVLTTSVILLVQ